jgi:hypothetical protein
VTVPTRAETNAPEGRRDVLSDLPPRSTRLKIVTLVRSLPMNDGKYPFHRGSTGKFAGP